MRRADRLWVGCDCENPSPRADTSGLLLRCQWCGCVVIKNPAIDTRPFYIILSCGRGYR